MKKTLKCPQTKSLINPSLSNISLALKAASNPQDSFASIHVAGTNGKGSVVTFLDLLYRKYFPHLKIGKYISPHLINYEERISINGLNISSKDFEELKSWSEQFSNLTEFEKLTLIAFEYFAKQKIDLAILETGMGGRWDATNTVNKKLATVITNIGFDHMDYLGNTLEKIRYEKEGIKRESVPHFEGDFHESKNPNYFGGQNFELAKKVFVALTNINLDQNFPIEIFKEFAKEYLGRFCYQEDKNLILDGAHNPDAAKLLQEFITSTIPHTSKIYLLAFLDKDFENFCKDLQLSQDDIVILTKVNNTRARDPEIIAAKLKRNCIIEKDLDKAFKYRDLYYPKRTLIITGSLYLIGAYLAKAK